MGRGGGGGVRGRRLTLNTGFRWERQKERDHQEDAYVGGRIILQNVRELGWDGMAWAGLVWSVDQ
jgi:hypothetical protein